LAIFNIRLAADTDDLKKFYPTSVLVTGYDILFFWVARMMMMGLFAMDGKQPFNVIALHGLVRDQFGKKMSKSRGNTVDPIEFMDKYGSDALRFTLARGATRELIKRSLRIGLLALETLLLNYGMPPDSPS